MDETCKQSSCGVYQCRQRHPRECKFFKEYNRCKFNPCKFNHITNNSREIDIEQFREDNLKTVAKLNDIEQILDEKKDLEAKINICDEKLKVFETKISEMEFDGPER